MANIDDEFEMMLEDCLGHLGDTCTITLADDGVLDPATGVRTEGGTTASVQAIRTPRRTERGPGGADIQHLSYHIRASVGVDVKRGYKITDGTDTFWVHRVEKEVNDLALALYVQSLRPV